jgi:ribosomal protein S14
MHRQALRYIIRNTTLPPRTRAIAQLQLTQMHCYTRPTQIRNRCIMGGKGRGVLGDFKLSRVRRTVKQFAGATWANTCTVQLPYGSPGGQFAGCEEGQLVKGMGSAGGAWLRGDGCGIGFASWVDEGSNSGTRSREPGSFGLTNV